MTTGGLIDLITVVGAAIQQVIASIDPLLTWLTCLICKPAGQSPQSGAQPQATQTQP